MQFLTAVLVVSITISSCLIFPCCGVGSGCTNSNIAYTIKVSQQATGQAKFSRVQDAIDSIPSDNKQWTRVLLAPGTYKEQVHIPYDKQCVVLQGSNPSQTVIAFDGHGGSDMGATFTASADNFMSINIGFKNTYGSSARGNWTQAAAIRVYGDKSAFYNCYFTGIQDTIFDVVGRHYFKSCRIEGAVDFIWGSGQSVYEDCDIRSLFGAYVTAHGRPRPSDPGGFVFLRGKVGGAGPAYLGRAYNKYARVVFHRTFLDRVVNPRGWDAWEAVHQEKSITYIEKDCTGPGASLRARVPWMKKQVSSQEMSQYTVSAFIDRDGWISRQPNANTLSKSSNTKLEESKKLERRRRRTHNLRRERKKKKEMNRKKRKNKEKRIQHK